jgi:hypothetical protein
MEKKQWGYKNNELKYTYESEVKESPIKEIKMTKEEFDKYIKDLEMKNKWKENNYKFGGCR